MQKRFEKLNKKQEKVLGSQKQRAIFFVSMAFVLILFSSCIDRTQPPVEYMPNMRDSRSVKAQEGKMRTPPAGALPVNFESYPYAKNKEGEEKAAQELKNPLPRTADVFARGQQAYSTYCIVCHGPTGLGDGYIVPKFPRPPSLVSDKVRNWTDGHLYHVITVGQNLMPSYASQILPEDRWALIHYLRAMHRASKPTPEDVEELKKIMKEGKIP